MRRVRGTRARGRNVPDGIAALVTVLVLAGAWAGAGYAIGGVWGAVIGGGAGLAAAALLRWLVSRIRVG